MAKHGKKYTDLRNKIDKSVLHTVPDAVKLLKEVSFAKFDETIQLDVRLGVDPRNAEQQVRGTCALPHGTGKKVRVAVFASGDNIKKAEDAGADVVGGEDLVKRVQEGFLDFEAAIATPDMMRFVGRLGKVLGPRGMMPNPKVGTVTNNVADAVTALKAGQVEYRLDRYGIVHVPVGKKSFEDNQLVENIYMMLETLQKAKPAAAKGTYMKSISLNATMSPGIRIDAAEAKGASAPAA